MSQGDETGSECPDKLIWKKMDSCKIECNESVTNTNNAIQLTDNDQCDDSPTVEDESTFMCEVCKREFLKKSSLRRHIITSHMRERPKPNNTSIDVQKKPFPCSVEGCTFQTNHAHNLRRHNAKVHLSPNAKPVKTMHKCAHCHKRFADTRNLRYHSRKVHNTGDLILAIKRQCPLCPFTSTEHDKTQIHTHFENDHGIPMVWENRQFNTMGDFINWKHNTEKLTTTSYVRAYCTPSLLSFHCHRSGSYKKKGFDKRRIKEGGSCKINAFCPSAITVKVYENNVVCASYLATHIGHTNEPEHIRMTPEERSAMRAQRGRRKRISKESNSSTKRDKIKKATPENRTTVKRTNAEIEMEKLMLEVQQDMEECAEDAEPPPPEHAIFLEHVANVHTSSVECLNLPHGTVENCQITVLTPLEPSIISCIDLQEERNKFLDSFIRCINESVQTLDDLEYVRQHCQAILPTLGDSIPLIAQQPDCESEVSEAILPTLSDSIPLIVQQPGCESQVSVITQLTS